MNTTRIQIDDKTVSALEAALRSGGKMRAFLSGGGLRVVRIEVLGKLVAYGEHPIVSQALRICAEDFLCGGRRYKDVYGNIEPHYLTGQSESDGDLDAWVRKGSTFDASYHDYVFLFILRGFDQHEAPAGVHERAMSGETVTYTDDRGVVFESSPVMFPNGEIGSSTRVVSKPESVKGVVWMWESVKKGKGKTLLDAVESSFAARSESEES